MIVTIMRLMMMMMMMMMTTIKVGMMMSRLKRMTTMIRRMIGEDEFVKSAHLNE